MMSSLSEKTWLLDKASADDISALLTTSFNVSLSPPVKSKLVFFDDFDFHIWKAGYILYKTHNQQFNLVDPTGRVSEVGASKDACFWWDFSEEKSLLQSLIGVRAVIPLTTLKSIEQGYSLCNEDKKVVVKASLMQFTCENTTNNYLTLKPLRGYDKDFNKVENIINNFVKDKIDNFGFKYILSSNAIHLFERKYVEIHVNADMPTEDFVRKMALGLLDTAKEHINGTVDDIDTEFLHQFRVSFRKLRSLVALLKRALPHQTVEVVKPGLSLIARETNKLRDLDVFLLDESKYRKLLPENFNDGLSELYVLIRKQRKEEQENLARYFSSETYINEMAACTKELSLPSTYETNMARKPVLQVAKKLLLNRYHKMLMLNACINNQSPDEDIHELRIEFKKFRYLIEFFVGFLHKKDTARLIDDVKKIQSVLGNFNDYSTQIIFLNSYMDDNRIEMSKSLCGLVAVLHQKQTNEKRKVNYALKEFFTKEMGRKITVMFGSTKQGDLQ